MANINYKHNTKMKTNRIFKSIMLLLLFVGLAAACSSSDDGITAPPVGGSTGGGNTGGTEATSITISSNKTELLQGDSSSLL